MKIDLGTGVVIAAALLFYLRLIVLQWGKVKQSKSQSLAAKPRKGKKSNRKAEAAPASQPAWLGIRFSNMYLMLLGVVLFATGAFMDMSPLVSAGVSAFWWIPILAGLVLFTVLIR